MPSPSKTSFLSPSSYGRLRANCRAPDSGENNAHPTRRSVARNGGYLGVTGCVRVCSVRWARVGWQFLCSASTTWLEPSVFAVSGAACLCSELYREPLKGMPRASGVFAVPLWCSLCCVPPSTGRLRGKPWLGVTC